MKQRAAVVIDMGPPALSREDERRLRYGISDLVDDLRAPRSREEMVGAGSRLFEELANHYLRSHGLWSGRAKSIPRALRRADAELCEEYCASFEKLFRQGDVDPVLRLAEKLLEPGGFLFEGYRLEAPVAWRKRLGGAGD